MSLEKNQHPGPFCVICKEPFGNPNPIGITHDDSGNEMPIYYNETVGNNEINFCQCLDCMQKDLKERVNRLIETLNDKQKEMYNDIMQIYNDISSYTILMS